MITATLIELRTLDAADHLPDNYVNPYYLGDLKKRISVARVGWKLYAFHPDAARGLP
jgi:3-phenylpropionate/trans-cinnamate dioxygenase ferredoxin subunit